jgi:murein DD-endopeptidase MepM/ murein hydrolase activator NlpD
MYVLPILLMVSILANQGKETAIKHSTNCFAKFNLVKQVFNIPFAIGDCNALWPVITNHSRAYEVPYKNLEGKYVNGNSARAFGATREDGQRYHVGIDLYCNDQDVCIAVEDGTIVGIQGFLNITKALLLQTKSGMVVLYGEIEDGSWNDFTIKKGSIVKKGQKICRIGKNQKGTQMLHFETYVKGTIKNSSWSKGSKTPPNNILNPTKYLLNIASTKK